MLTVDSGKTGTAPGTITLTVGPHSAKLAGFGQAETTPIAYQAAVAELEVHRARLAVEKAHEELKSARSDRLWGAVTALVGVGGLIVAILALRNK
jgi:hypothetical protein